ncbi:MAG: hypothetical protein ACPGQL_09725 [Thermoplasmatota archaeon]
MAPTRTPTNALLLTALAGLLLAAPGTVAQVAQEAAAPYCDLQAASDPAGDQQYGELGAVVDLSPTDILGVAMAAGPDGIRMSLELGGDPRDADSLTFSYWVGFEDAVSDAGYMPTWTFQGSTTYDVISTMYWNDAPDFPVVWKGTTFSFTVPWTVFQAQYGDAWPVAIGTPSAHAAGPAPALPYGALNNPSQDWASYSDELEPLAPCMVAAPAAGPETETQAPEVEQATAEEAAAQPAPEASEPAAPITPASQEEANVPGAPAAVIALALVGMAGLLRRGGSGRAL